MENKQKKRIKRYKLNSYIRQKKKRGKAEQKVIPLPEKKSHDIVYKNRRKNVISSRSPGTDAESGSWLFVVDPDCDTTHTHTYELLRNFASIYPPTPQV